MPPILDVDVNDLPDSDVVPGGKYKLRVDDITDVKEDKNEEEFVGFEYSIVEGDHTGRKLFEPYVKIRSGSTFKKICKACRFNKAKLGSSDELIGLEFWAMIKVQDSENFGEQNRISVYLIPNEGKPKKR